MRLNGQQTLGVGMYASTLSCRRQETPSSHTSSTAITSFDDVTMQKRLRITLDGEPVCIATDLFLLRPNIEHYMLAVIFGRGGGPEELGATFWGQTELSCYDDSQHGILGMSYKYHERAIVNNERNLIRVFDVCFDGYCGGNDARIMRWTTDDVSEFQRASVDLTTPYSGPSFVVMSLPQYRNVECELCRRERRHGQEAIEHLPEETVAHIQIAGCKAQMKSVIWAHNGCWKCLLCAIIKHGEAKRNFEFIGRQRQTAGVIV